VNAFWGAAPKGSKGVHAAPKVTPKEEAVALRAEGGTGVLAALYART